MIKKNENIVIEGKIKKKHWQNYEVLIGDKFIATLVLKWVLKRKKLQFIEWDKVEVELNPIDPTKWYIISRL